MIDDYIYAFFANSITEKAKKINPNIVKKLTKSLAIYSIKTIL